MKFTVTEAEARQMAQFEEEVNCDISAGSDWGSDFDQVLELVLTQIDNAKLTELISEQLGQVLSLEEVKELVASFQSQVREKVAEKRLVDRQR
ncbi:hypothetical protein ACKFKF_23415 [Phormidesmis sp. 146-12]